jgi:exopolyphosphatase/guanosine-5'-triphosphate,3'-diphosphate pyrophosphatase
MTPQRPRSADAIPKAVESTAGLKAQVQTLYAALDLGTNSCRMLIAQPEGAQFKIVDSFSKSVQLGHGLEEHGRLSRASMERTLQALRVCSQKLRHYRVKKMRLVATEACRRAANGAELMRQIRKETGLKLEIIKAEEEAQLAVLSCAPLVNRDTDQLLVVDIGGGSTELVWIDLVDVQPKLRSRAIMHMHRGFRSGRASE